MNNDIFMPGDLFFYHGVKTIGFVVSYDEKESAYVVLCEGSVISNGNIYRSSLMAAHHIDEFFSPEK